MATNAPLAANEIRFRSLFENTLEIILYQNAESIILDANPAFLALVGEPKERVVEHSYNEFLPPEVHELFAEKLREAFTGKTVRFDLYASQGKSAPRHWDVVKVPLWEQGHVVGVHMVGRDISDKTRAQEELFAQNQDLQQFTYIVSHNLRAPLANAIGLVNLLGTETPDSAYFEETRAHLQQNLAQLDQVLQDMNTILAVRDRQSLTVPEDVKLVDVLTQAIRSLQDMLNECGGTVQVDVAADLVVRANRAYLYSIFFNLLSNAIKYRAEARSLRVVVSATGEPGQSKTVTVADNGSGFDLARAGADVFKLYKRFHPNHPGRGIGLYLVKSHIDSMGGRITVRSQVDAGTSFTLLFP
jgi:PAS domain S-box-containing protein